MAQNKPLLSVLMPAYNAEKYVAEAIASLLVQTYPNLEILICDDCSTDGTAAVIKTVSDARITFFKNDVNRGKNKTAETLLAYAKGDFISIHDADDISLPERFEKQMHFLMTHPDFAMCGTNFISMLENGQIIDKSALLSDTAEIREGIRTQSRFHGPTVVIRKDVLPQVGGFYRYFTWGEDIDLTMRIAERYNTTNLKEHLYLYRHVSTSLTNSITGYSFERWGNVKLLQYLSDERSANNGVDSLMRGDLEHIKEMMIQFTAEYKGDPTVTLRRGVFRLLGMKMYKNAVLLSLNALRRKVNMLNVKCVIYALLASVKGIFMLMRHREKVDLTFLKSRTENKA